MRATSVEAATGNFDAAAEIVASRMADENSPAELRALASGLYGLRDNAGAQPFEKAAAILAARIHTQLDPSAIRSLALSLSALAAKSRPEPYEEAASAIVANVNGLARLEPAFERVATRIRPEKARELSGVLAERIGKEPDPNTLRVLGQFLADLPAVAANVNLARVLAIPQAPCLASHSASELRNPLCSEDSWTKLAASVVHAKEHTEDLEPDFIQLAPDDDDAPTPDSSEEEAALDFHQLSNALNATRSVAKTVGESSGIRWTAVGLLIAGTLMLLFPVGSRAAVTSRS
jgi:hypothetical protein